ncbi:hypothetical protein JL720_8199 [Aureococcus anophagefferens]|nr:hypothetical protein JL720_8199 [Aureococcus anophagefferens]
MARRRWLAPLLVLCGVVGADDASAEIGFDFVMATVVGATLVQALDFVSSQSTQLAYASRNGLLFNGTVAETTTMKTLMATAQNLGALPRGTRARALERSRPFPARERNVLAIYAGFDADHAYYAYAYLREDFYKSSGARAASAGNLTVTLGKNVKGKGKLDAEKYVSRGRCDDFDYDLCAVAFTSDALGEPVDALKTTKFDCTTTHWFRSSVKYKTPRWTTPYAMPADVAAGVGYTIAAPLFDAEGKLRGAAGADVGLSRVSEIIAATARTWWREDLGAYDPKGLFFYVVDADLRVVASSVGPRVAPADDLFHYAPNSSNALVANGSAAYVAGVVAGDLRVVNGTFTYVSALDFAIGGLEWYLVTAYDADCPAGYEVRGLGCDPCEDARDSLAGSPVCDRCLPGFYLRGSSCASCPDNGVCLGGLDAPYPREGYWGDAASPHEFYECEPGHCRKKFRCRPGYTGRLCSRLESVAATRGAADRYFTISSSLPFKCPQTTRNRWLLTGSSILAVVLGWLYVNNVLLNVYAPLGMLVYSVQHMAIIARYQIDFPRGMLVCALGLLRFVPVTTRVAHKFATDRAYRSFGAVFASLRYEGEFGPQIARGVTEFLSLLDVQHTTIAFNSLHAIRCDEINGAWYMREDPQVRCDGDNPQRVLYLAFSLLYFFGVVLGLPTYIYYRVQMAYLHDNGVHSPEMLDTLGWAYERFRAPLHDWQFRLTMRTVLICAIATCVDNGSVQEMGQTFKQLPFHVWATDARRDAGDYERFAAVAADLKPYVANDSPTSSYSADSRAVFWRKLAQEFPGMIDFCMTELSQVERTVYFGALLRMERYMQRPVRAQALHYLVEDQDRSSVLYYILAAEEHRVVDLRSFRKQSSSAALRQRAAEDGEENVYAHCVDSESAALRVAFDVLGHAKGDGGGEAPPAPGAVVAAASPDDAAGLDYGRDDAAAREQSCFGPGDVAPPPPAPRPPEPGSPKRKESKKHHKKKHQK